MEAGTGLVDDLATLSDLTEDGLLTELFLRYRRDEIYTYIGDVLIAVNPFKQLPIYGVNHASAYRDVKIRAKSKPHIYGVADNTYQSLVRNKASQCVVVSGESGAGKTESTKLMVRHIAYLCSNKVATRGKNLSEQLVEVNPLLEAFGNARTTINNNSSRFGKYIELLFTGDGTLTGGRVSIFLLEKSRVVKVGYNERNFHIFYYMLVGLPQELKKKYFLDSSEPHRLLRNPSDNGSILKDAAEVSHCTQMFQNLLKIMEVVGFKDGEVNTIFEMLSAILHIREIHFEHDDETDGVYVVNEAPLEIVAQLLQISAVELATVLISNVTEVRGEKITNLKTVHHANDGRDALAKALYARLFSWIVHYVNETIAPTSERAGEAVETIGLLDIAGFENFQYNSFEQLCINLANEQLQSYFNEHIFAQELDDLRKENVSVTDLKFTSNDDIIQLFVEKPLGLMSLLDEESKFPKATDNSLLEKFKKNLCSKHHFRKTKGGEPVFSIAHYAGNVTYHVSGFLEKNRDTLSANIVECLTKSQSRVVYDLFSAQISDRGDLDIRLDGPARFQRAAVGAVKGPAAHHLSNNNKASLSRMAGRRLKEQLRAMSTPAGIDYLPRSVTAGSQFLVSLTALRKKLSAGEPHFIRCIKPNQDKRPEFFVSALVLQQLRYTGVLETVRIRREGYPTRLPFQAFLGRYKFISYPLLRNVAADAQNCQAILIQAGLTLWEIGYTKVFLKYWHTEQLNAVLDKRVRLVVTIQKHVRGYLGRKRVQRLKEIVDARRAAITKSFLHFLSDSCHAMYTQLLASNAADVARKHQQELEAALERQRAEELRRRAADDERKRRQAEEVERQRRQAEEEERKRRQAEEEERKRRHAEEEERKRRHAQDEERKRLRAVEEAKRQRVAEEEERKRKIEDERRRLAAAVAEEQQQLRRIAAQSHHAAAERESAAHTPNRLHQPRAAEVSAVRRPSSAGGSGRNGQQLSSAARRAVSTSLEELDRQHELERARQQHSQHSNVEGWLAANANHRTHVRELREKLEAKSAVVTPAAPSPRHRATPVARASMGPLHVGSVAATAGQSDVQRRVLSASETDLSRMFAERRPHKAARAAAAAAASSGGSRCGVRARSVHVDTVRDFPSSGVQHLPKSAGSPNGKPQWRSQLAALTGMDTIKEYGFDLGDASHYARSYSSNVVRSREDVLDRVVQEVECDVMRSLLGEKNCWCYLLYAERTMHCAGRPCCYQEVLVDGAPCLPGSAADAGHHVGLGSVSNPYRDPHVAKLREHIGKGLVLKIDGEGNVWATRRSVNEVEACYQSDLDRNCLSSELIRLGGKLPIGLSVKIFDMSRFIFNVIKAMHTHGLRRLDRERLKRMCVVSLGLVSSATTHDSDGGQHPLVLHVLNLVALRAVRDEKVLKELEKTMFKLAKTNVDFTNISVPTELKFKLTHRVPSKYVKPTPTDHSNVHDMLYVPDGSPVTVKQLHDDDKVPWMMQKLTSASGHGQPHLGGRRL